MHCPSKQRGVLWTDKSDDPHDYRIVTHWQDLVSCIHPHNVDGTMNAVTQYPPETRGCFLPLQYLPSRYHCKFSSLSPVKIAYAHSANLSATIAAW